MTTAETTQLRAPCGDWPAALRPHLGSCGNSLPVESHSLVRNTTRVADWNVPPDPNGIAPYWRNIGGSEFCGEAGEPPCGPWGYPPSTLNGNISYSFNEFVAAGTSSEQGCNRLLMGFKNTQAKKAWHGRTGFLQTCENCFSTATKYTGVNAEMSYGCTQDTWVTTVDGLALVNYFQSATRKGNASVGTNTGVITLNSCEKTDVGGPEDPANFGVPQPICVGTLGIPYYKDLFNALAGMRHGCGGINYNSNPLGFFPTGDIGYVKAWWTGSYQTDNPGNMSCELDVTDTTLEFHWLWTWEYIPPGGSWGDENSFHLTESIDMTCELGGPYTSTDLASAVTGLLDYWDLGNNVLYPWRLDNYLSVAPLVHYNEVGTAVSPDILPCSCSYEDPNSASYDGSVVGSPVNISASSNTYVSETGSFGWLHDFYEWDDFNDRWDLVYYGAYSGIPSAIGDTTDEKVPQTATQWTRNDEACTLFPGAWWQFLGGTTQVLTAQKWAEVSIRKPSHNHYRPCCLDRFTLDESGPVTCILSYAGLTDTSVILTCTSDGFAIDDQVAIWGGDLSSSLWTIEDVPDGSTLWLKDKVQAPWDFSSGSRYGDLGGACGLIGKRRFTGSWAICGRAQITAKLGDSPVTFSLDSTTALLTGDIVTISGSGDIDGHWPVTMSSATVLALHGSTTADNYIAGGYCQHSGSPAWYWNDSGSKGDFVTAAWPMYSGSQTSPVTWSQECYHQDKCSPTVIICSPNTESFGPNAKKLTFPSVIALKDCNSFTHVQIIQHMGDPLFQLPSHYCIGSGGSCTNGGDSIAEDSGVCAGDELFKRYWPMRDQLEARVTTASGAPSLPSGITFTSGYPTTPQSPGNTGNLPNVLSNPWIIYINESSCICSSGSFYKEYAANLVSCVEFGI